MGDSAARFLDMEAAQKQQRSWSLEMIGDAVARVLGKARKAAIARQKEIADAKRRDPAVFGQTGVEVTRQHAAPATAGEHAELERARITRPAGSKI